MKGPASPSTTSQTTTRDPPPCVPPPQPSTTSPISILYLHAPLVRGERGLLAHLMASITVSGSTSLVSAARTMIDCASSIVSSAPAAASAVPDARMVRRRCLPATRDRAALRERRRGWWVLSFGATQRDPCFLGRLGPLLSTIKTVCVWVGYGGRRATRSRQRWLDASRRSTPAHHRRGAGFRFPVRSASSRPRRLLNCLM